MMNGNMVNEMIERISRNAAETYDFAESLARNARPGEVYALDGDLGTGKTVFAKGFAMGLGVSQDVTSPTFAIVNEYEGRLPLYHFDVYRINSIAEMEDTGCEDYFYGKGVCLVEWAEMIAPLLPANTIRVRLERDAAENDEYRKLTVWGLEHDDSCD